MRPSILTHSGVMFNLLNPDPTQIELGDIAHALARITRFTGHGDLLFSDAQHSVIVYDLAPPELKRWALLHDAEEAYVNDMSSPMKRAMRSISDPSPYDIIVSRVRAAVSLRFGVPIEDVRRYDDAAAMLEARINGPHNCDAHTWPAPEGPLLDSAIQVWPTELAEFMFLARAKELGLS